MARLSSVTKASFTKKGVAIQFNWIFVLIGGAVIFGFFFSLISNIMSGEKEQEANRATSDLDTLLKVNLASGNTQKVIPFNKKISFLVDSESTFSEYSVAEASDRKSYEYNAIFSPPELDGGEIIISTVMLDAPYSIMPVVYVTNKDVEYVLVGSSNSQTLVLLKNAMPENATVRNITPDKLSSYADYNFDRTVFVVDGTDSLPVSLPKFKNSPGKVFAVVINSGESSPGSYGNLSFYHYTTSGFKPDKTLPFINVVEMAAGVISSDADIYETNIRKILKRTGLLSQLQMKRMSSYITHYQTEPGSQCPSYYNQMNAHLTIINQKSADGAELSSDDFKELFLASNNIKTLNSYLVSVTECPPVY